MFVYLLTAQKKVPVIISDFCKDNKFNLWYYSVVLIWYTCSCHYYSKCKSRANSWFTSHAHSVSQPIASR